MSILLNALPHKRGHLGREQGQEDDVLGVKSLSEDNFKGLQDRRIRLLQLGLHYMVVA